MKTKYICEQNFILKAEHSITKMTSRLHDILQRHRVEENLQSNLQESLTSLNFWTENTSLMNLSHLVHVLLILNYFVNGLKDPWKVLLVVSKWYDELFENWLFWYQKLSIDMEIILLPEDEYIKSKYSNFTGIKVMSMNYQEEEITCGENMDFNKPGFKKLDQKRPMYLLTMLNDHTKLIYTDVDTVWLKDPRPYLVGNYDFWGQIDGILDGKPYTRYPFLLD